MYQTKEPLCQKHVAVMRISDWLDGDAQAWLSTSFSFLLLKLVIGRNYFKFNFESALNQRLIC